MFCCCCKKSVGSFDLLARSQPLLHPIFCAFSRENFQKSPVFQSIAGLWGQNLLTFHHGPEGPWKANRALSNPAFKTSSVRGMSPIFAQETVKFTRMLMDHVEAHPGTPLDFAEEFDRLALNVISLAGFGFDINASQGHAKEHPFLNSLRAVLAQAFSPLMLLPYNGPFLRWKQAKNLGVINSVFYKVIDERIKEGLEGKRDPERVPDLLDAMMKPGDDGQQLNREELRNELLLFYIAGHETSANILNWALLEISRHPEVHANVMDEINSVMGDTDKLTCPTPAQLEEMPYLEMILKETLRLYPPARSVSREVPETFEYKGLIFPKGMIISSAIFMIQRDPELWPEPDKFDPERFSKDNTAGRHVFSFFPFSAGPRICIGKNFFYLESKMLLVNVLRNLSFQVDETKPLTRITTANGIIKPSSNWLKVSLAH